jgi:hypothetical protein
MKRKKKKEKKNLDPETRNIRNVIKYKIYILYDLRRKRFQKTGANTL